MPKIRVTRTDVWFVETDDYTVAQLRQDEKDYGCLAIDLARNKGDHQTTTITVSAVKE